VADDHHLFRTGIISVIHSFGPEYRVISEASNGKELVEKLQAGPLPQILLLDMNMPFMDGYSAARQIYRKHPSVKIIVLTMLEDEATMIRMLRLGISGYLGKDVDPDILKQAIDTTIEKGFYYTDVLTGKLIEILNQDVEIAPSLTDRELEFIDLACSEFTYKQIAEQMNLSAKTIDGYRQSVFDKLNVRSRVGMVLYAIKNKLVIL
jgi:two-component system invasion response regulator UvrY